MIIEKSARESGPCTFRTRILQIALHYADLTKTFGAEVLVWLMKKPGGRTLALLSSSRGRRQWHISCYPGRCGKLRTFGHFVQPPRFVAVVDISRFDRSHLNKKSPPAGLAAWVRWSYSTSTPELGNFELARFHSYV